MLPSPHSKVRPSFPGRTVGHSLRWRVVTGIAGFAIVTATLALTQQPQDASQIQPRPWAASQPAAIRMPDANAQMQMQQSQQQNSKGAKVEAANSARRKQIADDAAKLLELATELKAEVDKTDKDTLSLQVIKKAESIERLAKGVKEKMKLTAGAS